MQSVAGEFCRKRSDYTGTVVPRRQVIAQVRVADSLRKGREKIL